DTTASGDSGVGATGSSTNGGAGGGGGLPLGGSGGAGGSGPTPTNAGLPGVAPGGGGGGGRGATNGHGAGGAKGAVVIAYYVTYGSVIIDGEEKFIVRIQYKDLSGNMKLINRPSRIASGVRRSLVAVRP